MFDSTEFIDDVIKISGFKKMAKILVTGATGFIGKRLIYTLLKNGHEVYALVRLRGTEPFSFDEYHVKILWGDLLNPLSLNDLPEDIDAAYYLVHSMGNLTTNLSEQEKKATDHFIEALKKTRVKQIIYLGGIVHDEHLSKHLESRLLVEDVLKKSGIPTTVLRASIIVGSGSASFEIIRDLVEKLPIMVAPRWINSRCQPISIRDVLFYLRGVLLNSVCYDRTFEIGGPDALSFKELMLQYAEERNLKRYIITVPVLTPRLSSYWLVFVTSVKFSLAQYLVESMKSNSFVKDKSIQDILPHKCLTYREAIRLAFLKISQNEVTSTWKDAWTLPGIDPDLQKYIQVPTEGVLSNVQLISIPGSEDQALSNIWSLGGQHGWYTFKYLWSFRGLLDKLVGGPGITRGRRHPHDLNVGDTVDFWRVLKADKKDKHLILFAEMKLPGEAWLEFKIEEVEKGPQLFQRATYRPNGILGRLYWYLLTPFHYFIFKSLAKNIVTSKN